VAMEDWGEFCVKGYLNMESNKRCPIFGAKPILLEKRFGMAPPCKDMSQNCKDMSQNRNDRKTQRRVAKCRKISRTCRGKSQGHVTKSQGHVAKSQFFETCLCDLATRRKESQKIAIICEVHNHTSSSSSSRTCFLNISLSEN